jgi:hypothetical protein
MTQTIDFVNADNGKVELKAGDRVIIRSNNAQELAWAISKYGMDAWYSSSMQFAAEYGFETNEAAIELLNKAIAIVVEAQEETLDKGIARKH